MGKRAGKKRRRPYRERHDARVAAGGLVEVLWEGSLIRVKPAVSELLDEVERVKSAAAAWGLGVVVSLPRHGLTYTAHVQFNSWATGLRVLNWWPGNGTWTSGQTPARGKVDTWQEAVSAAARLDAEALI